MIRATRGDNAGQEGVQGKVWPRAQERSVKRKRRELGGFQKAFNEGGKAPPKTVPTGDKVPTEGFWALLSGWPEMTKGTENNGPAGLALREGGSHCLVFSWPGTARGLCALPPLFSQPLQLWHWGTEKGPLAQNTVGQGPRHLQKVILIL